ncbi:hypothetical protein MTO96_026227, partial [Rhipicephalus appendiculatus]
MRGKHFEGDIVMEEIPEAGPRERAAPVIVARNWPTEEEVELGGRPLRRPATDKGVGIDDDLTPVGVLHAFPGACTSTQADVCYSYLGRNGGEQTLSLGDGCLYNGTVAHELLHVVGFYHEHTRPDRDDYVDVFERNIMP